MVGNISQWCHSGLDPESRFYVPLHRYPETGSRWFQQPAPSVTVKVVEQTRPKETRLPCVLKTGNKDDKVGGQKITDPIPSLRANTKQSLLPSVIPDLIRNLGFVTPPFRLCEGVGFTTAAISPKAKKEWGIHITQGTI